MSQLKKFDGFWLCPHPEGYGNVMALTSSWSSSFLKLLEKHQIKVLRLSKLIGWPDRDISFLSELPNLRGIEILSDNVTDITPIFGLTRVQKVGLTCKATTCGDFGQLRELESIFLDWRSVYRSLYQHQKLERINILNYPDRNLMPWLRNGNMRDLRLSSRQLCDLEGLDRFQRITRLDLFKCPRLESLSHLELAPLIQELEIIKCPKIGTISALGNLRDLRTLTLEDCGNIDSVAPLRNCIKLERLEISGNTNVIDGEFEMVKGLPHLKEVRMAERSHYTHSAEEIEN